VPSGFSTRADIALSGVAAGEIERFSSRRQRRVGSKRVNRTSAVLGQVRTVPHVASDVFALRRSRSRALRTRI
jgi:hypothetical protein